MEPHPFRQAFESQDLDGLLSLLAEDVIFHSPVIAEPGFEGRDSAAVIVAIALDLFQETAFTHDFGDDQSHVLVGDTRVLGTPAKMTWLLEFDDEGTIREFWLMARPLAGVIAIAVGVGQAAERAEQGSAVRELAEALVGPAADMDRAAANIISDINRWTAAQSAGQGARRP